MTDCENTWYDKYYNSESKMTVDDELFTKLVNILNIKLIKIQFKQK